MAEFGEMLEKIESDGLIDLDASRYINDLDIARDVLGKPLQYSQPVEAEVPISASLVKTLLPNMREQDADFFDIWEWQEGNGHAASQANLLNTFGIEPGPTVAKSSLVVTLAGRLAGVSSGAHQAMEVGVFSYMALGELETQIFYRALAREAAHRGEHGLARVMGHTSRQEGMHLNYQQTAASERYKGLRPWQQKLARVFLERKYTPVGVQSHNLERIRGFGSVVKQITEDDGVGIARELEGLATELLEISPDSGFVGRRYRQCVDSFLEGASVKLL